MMRRIITRGRCRENHRHAGVSAVVGSLLMLLTTVAIGTVLVSESLRYVNEFNLFMRNEMNATSERIVIEHATIWKSPGQHNLTLWIRNLGSSDVEINRIVLTADQDLLLYMEDSILVAPMQLRDITYRLDRTNPDHSTMELSLSVYTKNGSVARYWVG